MSAADKQLEELIRTAVDTALMDTRMFETVPETVDRTTKAVIDALQWPKRAHDPERKGAGWLFVAQGVHLISEYVRVFTGATSVEWEVYTEVTDGQD